MKSGPDNIQRLPNGAIDIAFYAARAHEIRSDGAQRGIRSIVSSMSRSFDNLLDNLQSVKNIYQALPKMAGHYTLTQREHFHYQATSHLAKTR